MSERVNANHVLLLTPTGSDTEMAATVLGEAGIGCEAISDLPSLLHRLREDAGAILLAEEALTPEANEELIQVLGHQEPWSDLPVLLMVGKQRSRHTIQSLLEFFGPAANVSLIERPFHRVTFLSAIRALLRARSRQYEIRRILAELRAALRARDDFVSMASHELRTPLTAMTLQNDVAQMAMKKDPAKFLTPARITGFVDSSRQQIARLTRLTDDLLDASRVHEGILSLVPSQMNLAELTRRIIEQLAPEFTAAGCTVKHDLPPKFLGRWDPYRMEQVVTNLLSNAAKYGRGGVIFVTLACKARGARLSVMDQGVGIEPDNVGRVFERFERVGAHTVSGLGIGLYIVKQIVTLHGGRIWVESVPGEGSTFHVQLPLE